MLERRRKAPEQPSAADSDAADQDTDRDEFREASEAARRDASQRAAELLARLRKL